MRQGKRLMLCMLSGVAAWPACVPPPGVEPRQAPDPLPLRDAAQVVNRNVARISGTLRAIGPVDGRVVAEGGRRRSFSGDGVLFYLPPRYVRFDLKSFGERQLLVGSNADDYWVYTNEENRFECGRHGEAPDPEGPIPLHPTQVIDALGLSPVNLFPEGDQLGVVQRITPDYQELLFLEQDDFGRVALQKEYWLDRFPPRLVRRVIFRSPDGVMQMESRLDDYERLGEDGPWLPGSVTAEWFDPPARLVLNFRRWEPHPEIGPESIQFATPPACLQQTAGLNPAVVAEGSPGTTRNP